ncbi:MAG: MFS transporter [Anaerolineae bacterium]|nr:MFS transporter [Anaerolineae bacterium]
MSPTISTLQPIRKTLAWLLELHKPVPERSEAEIAAEVERNYRWNFAVNLLDGAFFWFGASFMSTSTILPLFVSKLTPSPLAIGLLAVFAQASWFLPQLFTANAVERLARKKAVVVNLGLFLERLPVWGLVLAALIAALNPLLALAVFFICFAWHGLGAGALGAAWQDLIARMFPVERRGRFVGLTNFVGSGTGAVGAIASTWLLQNLSYPTNFAILFLIAATAILISWGWLALAREPVQKGAATAVGIAEYLAGLPDLLRRDHNFRRFLIARGLMALAGMGSGFVTVSALKRWHVPDSTAGLYTIALLAGQTFGYIVFGFLADRRGHKLALELAILASTVGFAFTWLAPAPEWYFVAFALFGIGSSAVIGSAMLMVMEFCEPERRPTYIGITSTSVGVIGIVAPLIGAGLASLSYDGLFAVCVAIDATALAMMHWWVQDPRWKAQGGRPNTK